MFTLLDLSAQEREKLAHRINSAPAYLYQCGAGLRTPSLAFSKKLIAAEPRLTIAGLLAPREKRNKKRHAPTKKNRSRQS